MLLFGVCLMLYFLKLSIISGSREKQQNFLGITKIIEKKPFTHSKQEKIGDYRRQTNYCDGENIYIED